MGTPMMEAGVNQHPQMLSAPHSSSFHYIFVRHRQNYYSQIAAPTIAMVLMVGDIHECWPLNQPSYSDMTGHEM